MDPQHFGTDPIDIRIRINQKSGFKSQIWFNFWHWRGFALSGALVIHKMIFDNHISDGVI